MSRCETVVHLYEKSSNTLCIFSHDLPDQASRLRHRAGKWVSTTYFILLAFFSDFQHLGLLISIVLVILGVTRMGNSILALLIWGDAWLHTPMYFLLSHLSLMDLMLIFTTLPKMATNFSGHRYTSCIGCRVQTFLYLKLGVAECVLLTLMLFDHSQGICSPLRYLTIMIP